MVKYNGKKIVYTFKYGTCFSMWGKSIYIIGTAFFFILGISLFIPSYLENDKFSAYEILIVSSIAGCLFLAISIYNWLKDRRAQKEILKCLADEHLFEACAEVYQFEESWGHGSVYYKLSINFENKGEKYSRFTSRSESVWYFRKIRKLVKSNKINILYSPQYGEVMVLENKQENK